MGNGTVKVKRNPSMPVADFFRKALDTNGKGTMLLGKDGLEEAFGLNYRGRSVANAIKALVAEGVIVTRKVGKDVRVYRADKAPTPTRKEKGVGILEHLFKS